METSTDISSPISTHQGPSGLTVNSYVDAVTAQEVYEHVMRHFLTGGETSSILIRFAWTTNACSTTIRRRSGVVTSIRSVISVTWDRWERSGDRTLAHEYGHAWGNYHRTVTMNDDQDWTQYLRARGLEGDDRVSSSYAWSPSEMNADDYRLLFGSENARQGRHLNWQIPHPDDVPGLKKWLRDVFAGGEETEIIEPEVPDEPEPPGPEEPPVEEPPVEEPEPPVEEPEPPVEEPPVEEPEPPVEEPPVEEPEPEPTTSLHISTTKERGVNHATLIWVGLEGPSVSIYRDGRHLITVPNTGRYLYNTGERGGRTITMRVCAGGVCTPEREASW